MKKVFTISVTAMMIIAFAACGTTAKAAEAVEGSAVTVEESRTAGILQESGSGSGTDTEVLTGAASRTGTTAEDGVTDGTDKAGVTVANVTGDGAIDATELFSDRDLEQEADTDGAENITLKSGEDYTVTEAGVYVFTGTATEASIIVDAADEDKVQIVLDGVSITNTDRPCIYIRSADKVFVTSTDSDNDLSVTGTFSADGETSTDAVIFAKDDLVLNGTGTVTVISTDNGISCKDDLKITGGTWNITSSADAVEANDSIRIADGNITITSGKDGLHAENDEDDTLGYIYICGGTLSVTAASDGIQATTILQIDGGTIGITGSEGLEGTWVQINGGTIRIEAGDDGINGSNKSAAYPVSVEINGGDITISMAAGDTDGIDSNGNLLINGGTLNITGQFPFDYDGTAEYNGGTIIVNGQETTTITNQFGGMGPGMGGGNGRNGEDGGAPGPGTGGNGSGFGPGFHG